MSGFLQKLRIITLGAANDLLSKEINMRSPSALRQYVRDLEEGLSKMKSEAATQDGAITRLNREHGDLATRINTIKTSIQADITAGRADVARQRATLVVTLQQQLDHNAADLENQKKICSNFNAAVASMELKHTQMLAKLRELESLDRQTKAQEQSASALSAINSLTGVDISVDDIESNMRARNDVATAKFNRAMDDASASQENPETTDAVDNLLASLTPKTQEKVPA
jgi:phage shock protein A